LTLDFETLAKEYYDAAKAFLKELIAVPSVYDNSTVSEEHPYGISVSSALKLINEKAATLGLKTALFKNRVVEIRSGAKTDNLITVAAHVDVVPATKGWTFDPFTLTEKHDFFYGRGITDDKGPLVAALFALKLLQDHHLVNDYLVNLVIGGDEERGSSCLKYYYHELQKPYPKYGFTPDADFPLIYAEKGAIGFKLNLKTKRTPIAKIHGGQASNMVIDECHLEYKKPMGDYYDITYLKERKLKFTYEHNHIKIIGKPAHAMEPDKGINAGLYALELLALYDKKVAILVELVKDLNGRGLNLYRFGPHLKASTLALCLLKYEKNQLELWFDYRYPEGMSLSQFHNCINIALTKIKPKITVFKTHELLFFDLNSKLVTTLNQVYQTTFKDQSRTPLTSGGGTYAKESKNMVAFGPMFEDEDDHIHGNDERMKVTKFYQLISVYAKAIYELGQLDASQIQSE
jgi:succinyl-diaminopimelate desuccinylase